ncbi:hypothetical protein DH2020_037975 [Rehmannia glutinosa]|uniref:4-coumarate--CoA ligase n=1 Tax=Rehmannia glutinosa TaxID=99300 RepID=A0ABR0V2E4_REHGL
MDKPDPSSIDPKTGFCLKTKIFYSLRPAVPLPPENTPLSAAAFALSLQSTISSPEATALVNSVTSHRISYSQFHLYVKALAFSLRTEVGLSRNDVAFVLSPNSTRVPILYFALLSIGVAVSAANPISTKSEISRQVKISKPVVAFATSATAAKLSEHELKTILIDSAEFEDMMTRRIASELGEVEVRQNDVAAILFSSGTTGQVKGVAITHRNFIAITANYYSQRQERSSPTVGLYTVPYFHVFGFHYCLKSVALGDAVVVMEERFELGKMLRAVEELKGYGMTETSGVAFRPMGDDEYVRWGSVGKLLGTNEAKIVVPDTGIALPPRKAGELWIKGPTVMKGYVGDPKMNSRILRVDGWLRTGDICYIDDEGFLFVVDRVKELIKYKGYQVSPAELEQLLLSHPDIVDAAVIPFTFIPKMYYYSYPDEEAGQVPLAFVVRCPKSELDEGQVVEFIGKQVAPYKKVRRVAFISSIPKSAAGKILRKELLKISLSQSKL